MNSTDSLSSILPKLRAPDAARYLGVSRSLLAKMRIRGGGPKYIKFGRVVLYDVRDIEDWCKQRRIESTSAHPTALQNRQELRQWEKNQVEGSTP